MHGAIMITSIQLINFQNHTDTILEFNDGINIITGSSDQGKTSIHRAFYWVAFNKPLGDAFMKDGQSIVKVIIKTDRHTIERVKSSSKNYYLVDNVKLNALRTEVPEQVTNILGISATNIQLQLEQHFLLSSTGGEVAKAINAVADLGDINTATTNINKTVRTLRDKKAFLDETIKKKEEQLNGFSGIDDLNIQATTLNNFIHKEKLLTNDIKHGQSIVISMNDYHNRIKYYTDFINDMKPLTIEIQQGMEDCTALNLDIIEIEQVIKRMVDTENTLKKFKELPTLTQVCGVIVVLMDNVDGMFDLIDDIMVQESNLRLREERLIDNKSKLADSIKRRKIQEDSMEFCPYCGIVFEEKRI